MGVLIACIHAFAYWGRKVPGTVRKCGRWWSWDPICALNMIFEQCTPSKSWNHKSVSRNRQLRQFHAVCSEVRLILVNVESELAISPQHQHSAQAA
mmetsp:Transcript_41604/g.94910  ORF Transcript_41604/g.94910 Transcript_41604/m.94910 type:complete len:96 (+) Transcript_41604:171-458(+)